MIFTRKLSGAPETKTEQKKACPIVIGDTPQLLKKIDEALLENKRELDKSVLKHRYNTEFRPLLSSHCLLLPDGMASASTHFLHCQHHYLTKKTPKYLSSYELMIQRVRIDDDSEWDRFWNQIITNRVFIAEDWESNIGNVETLQYDYGIKGFCKGEVDASFHDGKNGNPGKATISFIIWSDDKVICAEVHRNIDCSSIHVAEAYAVLALFFKCFEMGIERLLLWTDNSDIQGSVTGSYTVSQTRVAVERDLLLLLGCLARKFKQLTAVCKPREMLFLADELARIADLIPLSLNMEEAFNKFSYELNQKAMFRLSLAGPANAIVKNFGIFSPLRYTLFHITDLLMFLFCIFVLSPLLLMFLELLFRITDLS